MKIQSEILIPHVYMLSFETQYELCMSFVRMQEFYESPKFRGKYFTLEQYIDYWSKEFGNGAFTYPVVWNGFNIPGKVICDWREKFQDVRERETAILKSIDKLMRKEIGFTRPDDIEKVYVIGVNKEGDNKLTIQHELAHAMYSLYPEYRKRCKKIFKSVSKEEYRKPKNELIKMRYCNKMIDDELQAYFSTSDLKYDSSKLLGFRTDFVNNFNGFKNDIENN